jgi:hypothetical protein
VRLHLQLLARAVVQLVREKTVRAAHIAHACDQYVKQDGRERLAQRKARVTLQKLFRRVIHYSLKNNRALQSIKKRHSNRPAGQDET